MTKEKLSNKTEKEEKKRAKVRIDARVDVEILDKIEEIVNKTGDTKSKVINDLLSEKLESQVSSNSELSRLEKELDEKNEQIKSLLKQQENNQELELYKAQERQLELEIEKQQLLMLDSRKDEKEINEEKRGWFKWFK